MAVDFTIKQITRFDKKTLNGVNVLLRQWSKTGYQLKPDYFKALIKNSHVMALYDGEIMIGTVTLILMHKLSGVKGSIEHLMVDEKYRGQQLGEKLMLHIITTAKKLKVEKLSLMCEPHRIAANALYKKLGFVANDAQYYQLLI